MITDICYGIGNSYAFKTVAVGKSGFADTCNRIGNCYIIKAAAFAECTVAYACNGIRNANGCKTVAFKKALSLILVIEMGIVTLVRLMHS